MTGLLTYSNYMHIFLTKVVIDKLKACPRVFPDMYVDWIRRIVVHSSITGY